MNGKHSLRRIAAICSTLVATSSIAQATTEVEVTAVFRRFVTAQNAHDLKTVAAVLADSPQPLWLARGKPVWGREAMLKQFAENYKGTWTIRPDFNDIRIAALSPHVAQLFVPAMISIAPAGQMAESRRFLLTQVYVKSASGWRLAMIVTVPAA